MSITELFKMLDLEEVQEASWTTFVLFVIVEILLLIVVNLVLFPSGVLTPIPALTNGLIQVTLVVSLIGMIVIVGGVILVIGKQKLEDVGLNKKAIPLALFVTFLFWVIPQVIGLLMSLIGSNTFFIDPIWEEQGVSIMIGSFIAQLLGNALLEEVSIRGFLFPQTYKQLGQSLEHEPVFRLIIAIIISQVLAALFHLPNRIFRGLPFQYFVLVDLPFLFVVSVIFVLLYYRTNNIFIAVGIHSLLNAPMSIFISQDLSRSLILYLAAGFIILLFILDPVIIREQPSVVESHMWLKNNQKSN